MSCSVVDDAPGIPAIWLATATRTPSTVPSDTAAAGSRRAAVSRAPYSRHHGVQGDAGAGAAPSLSLSLLLLLLLLRMVLPVLLSEVRRGAEDDDDDDDDDDEAA